MVALNQVKTFETFWTFHFNRLGQNFSQEFIEVTFVATFVAPLNLSELDLNVSLDLQILAKQFCGICQQSQIGYCMQEINHVMMNSEMMPLKT